MTIASRVLAVVDYLLPVVGWVYVYLFHRKDALAVFHLRQSIGLFLFLGGTVVLWAVVAWVLAWIPLMAVLAVALFALVIASWIFGFIVWVLGLINAVSNRLKPLPGVGNWADRLPIR